MVLSKKVELNEMISDQPFCSGNAVEKTYSDRIVRVIESIFRFGDR